MRRVLSSVAFTCSPATSCIILCVQVFDAMSILSLKGVGLVSGVV